MCIYRKIEKQTAPRPRTWEALLTSPQLSPLSLWLPTGRQPRTSHTTLQFLRSSHTPFSFLFSILFSSSSSSSLPFYISFIYTFFLPPTTATRWCEFLMPAGPLWRSLSTGQNRFRQIDRVRPSLSVLLLYYDDAVLWSSYRTHMHTTVSTRWSTWIDGLRIFNYRGTRHHPSFFIFLFFFF